MCRRYHIHFPGLIYLALVALVGVALASRPNNMLVWVFAAMLASVMLSGVVSGFMLMRIAVVRSVPRTSPAGEPLIVRYQVRNGSRMWPVFALFIRELPTGPASRRDRARQPRAFLQHISPGESVVAETICIPKQRGRLQFERLRCETVFPFGLLLKSVRFEQHSDTLILPRMYRLRAGVLTTLASGGVAGSATSRRTGPGADFLGVREYRPGDSLRHISWKRSAATGTLAVVERSIDVPPRVHVAIDLRRPTQALRFDASAIDARTLEERAISLAASLLAQADRDGYELRLSVLGLPSPTMPLRRGHWHMQKALAVLGSLDLDQPRTPDDTIAADRERASIIVVHVDRADLTVGGAGAVHLTASQLATLVSAN
ncbi:MAG: DUF58 domain-containing protein, partial [Phycisphaerae bacterium]|nr:DUF58 domain-containing protein [Phycisphaerae bacterium]